MLGQDWQFILGWWGLILILGLAFFPATNYFFNQAWDRGYIFSKTLAVALGSYLIFLLGSWHLVAFTQLNAWLVVLIGAVVLSGLRLRLAPWRAAQASWKRFLGLEVLVAVTLTGWALVRSFNPDLESAEKFMDFGFVNGVLRSDYFPTQDMWWAGSAINYYYFGHVMTAVLTRLSGIPSAVSINLMIATVFALGFSSVLVMVATLVQLWDAHLRAGVAVGAGVVGAALVMLGGNLQTIYSLFRVGDITNVAPWWQLPLALPSYPNYYWYPVATRLIPNTIHEIPSYSAIVADPHGHFLDLPLVLVSLGVLLMLFMTVSQLKLPPQLGNSLRLLLVKTWPMVLLLGFLIGLHYMTNAWDSGIYLMVATLVWLAVLVKQPLPLLSRTILLLVLPLLSLIVAAIITLPFSLQFHPFVSGVGLICSPPVLVAAEHFGPLLFEPNRCDHSALWQLWLLYGFPFGLLASWAFFGAFFLELPSRGQWWTRLSWPLRQLNLADQFVLLLFVSSAILILIPDVVYLKDIFTTWYRANTMFKTTYQAVIMLGLSSGYLLLRLVPYLFTLLRTNFKIVIWPWLLVVLMGLGLIGSWPVLAVNTNYRGLSSYSGLNGTTYLQAKLPDYSAAVSWFNDHVSSQPVVLQAVGDSYSDGDVISSYTGLPTVLGWFNHEWFWRSDEAGATQRSAEVANIYQSSDPALVRSLLAKYQVRYVVVGEMERLRYPRLTEQVFNQLGQPVFRSGGLTVYQFPASY